MQSRIKQLVESNHFEYLIVSLILVNAVILGLETSSHLTAHYNDWLLLGNHVILVAFVIEALLKIYAVAPRFRRYFGSGWNLFDFSVVVFSLLPSTGEYAMIARLARLLRIARLFSTIPELRLIISTLVRSIPSMANVVILMGIIFYIYAVAGYHLFHQHDPLHWRDLGISLLTLFRVVTLEDWTDVMYTAMEAYPYAWAYFVSFVLVGTFIVVNLFIAVVLNNLDEAKREALRALDNPVDKEEILRELRDTREALQRLHDKLERSHPTHPFESKG